MQQLPKSIFKCFLVSKNSWSINHVDDHQNHHLHPHVGDHNHQDKQHWRSPVLRLLLHRGWRQLESHVDERRKSGAGAKVVNFFLFFNKNLCLAFQKSGWALGVADRGEPKRQGGQYFVWGGLTSLQIMWHLMEYHLNTRFFFIKDHYQQEIQHAAGVLDVNAFEWKVLNEVLIFWV